MEDITATAVDLYGKYSDYVENFQWEAGVTPLTDPTFVVATWMVYWAGILILKHLMKDRKGFSLSIITPLHNLVLCIWSTVMFVWMVLDIYAMIERRGWSFEQVFCLSPSEAKSTSDKVMNTFWFHVYIYYVSKFYELFDTAILVLKGRKVIFLHWYHHSIVIAMVWSWIEYKWMANFRGLRRRLGTIFNTFVHIFMYYYYMCSALKWSCWFKRYITHLQIVQFMSSFVLSAGYVYYYSTQECVGIESFLFSCACNASFLYLFIQFERDTYRAKTSAAQSGSATDKQEKVE